MAALSIWIMMLFFATIHAEDPRRRSYDQMLFLSDELQQDKSDDDGILCSDRNCLLKRTGQEDNGPFWANRGKKNPMYIQDTLFAEEPYWMLVRRDDHFQEEPFFVSRGKKDAGSSYNSLKQRDRRENTEDVDSPFFAARGKKMKTKN